MATNAERLDVLSDDVAELKANIAVMATKLEHLSAQLEKLTKEIGGNGKVGISERLMTMEGKVGKLQDCIDSVIGEQNRLKTIKERWYWIVVERLLVPIAVAITTALVLGVLK